MFQRCIGFGNAVNGSLQRLTNNMDFLSEGHVSIFHISANIWLWSSATQNSYQVTPQQDTD